MELRHVAITAATLSSGVVCEHPQEVSLSSAPLKNQREISASTPIALSTGSSSMLHGNIPMIETSLLSSSKCEIFWRLQSHCNLGSLSDTLIRGCGHCDSQVPSLNSGAHDETNVSGMCEF